MNIIKPSLNFRSLRRLPPSRVNMIVIHHIAHPTWTVHDIHAFHRNSNGWAGIGYNWFVDKQGRVYEGRGYNQGAHAVEVNRHSYGIALQGNFENERPTSEQWEATLQLTRKLMRETGVQAHRVVGHRDVGSTSCPGRNFDMNQFRRDLTTKSTTKEVNWMSEKLDKNTRDAWQATIERWADGDIQRNPISNVWVERIKSGDMTYKQLIRLMGEEKRRGLK